MSIIIFSTLIYNRYSCHKCPKRYFRAKYLQRHLKNSHLETKELTCPICNKTLKAVYNLKQHLLLHSDEKSYVCPFPNCTKAYKQKPGLDQHIRFIHKKYNSFCTICRRRVLNYVEHMKRIHPNHKEFKKPNEEKSTSNQPRAKRRRQNVSVDSVQSQEENVTYEPGEIRETNETDAKSLDENVTYETESDESDSNQSTAKRQCVQIQEENVTYESEEEHYDDISDLNNDVSAVWSYSGEIM